MTAPTPQALESQLAAIVESTNDAIIGKTLDGTITSWNGAAERMYGYEAREIIGMPISVLVPDDVEDDVPLLLDSIRRGETVSQYETVRVGKSGERIDVALTISPIRDEAGDVVGASTIARDVGDRKRADAMIRELNEALRHEVARVETLNQELEAVAYRASHDLKAPLVSIDGFAASLQRHAADALDDRGRLYLERIRANAASLQRLIEDTFEFARAGSGAGSAVSVDADAVAREVVASLADLAEKRGATVELVSPLPRVQSHPTPFAQALRNLLENALTHGRSDNTVVRISGAAVGDNVEIVVEDNGRGISALERPTIFDLFARGSEARENFPGGSGIGLALVKKVAELAGGSVRCEDSAGHGARFVLVFTKGTA